MAAPTRRAARAHGRHVESDDDEKDEKNDPMNATVPPAIAGLGRAAGPSLSTRVLEGSDAPGLFFVLAANGRREFTARRPFSRRRRRARVVVVGAPLGRPAREPACPALSHAAAAALSAITSGAVAGFARISSSSASARCHCPPRSHAATAAL